MLGVYKKNRLITETSTINILDIIEKNKNIFNNFLDGDIIIFNQNENIYKIDKRQNKNICGILNISSKVSYGSNKLGTKKKFISYDKNFPVFIVNTKQKFQPHDIYCVINFTKIENNMFHGKIVKNIGTIGDYTSEINFIKQLCVSDWINNKNFVLTDYSQDLTPNRIDFTKKNIYSIDPKNCIDIDDALHFEQIDDNLAEIGIHIADVSSFIPANSDLNLELQNRIESVYLNDQIDMIPPELSINKISLKEGQLRRAFSLILIVDINGKLVEHYFKKSFVRVKNLSYDDTQVIVNSKNNNDLLNLYQYAQNIYFFRYGKKIQNYDVHKMVEIYMIIANSLCAKTLFENGVGIYRTHKTHVKDKTFNVPEHINFKIKMIDNDRAEYCLIKPDLYHESLNEQYYTHFTSPIRRYVDIVSHRLLNKIINNDANAIENINNIIVDNINDVHNKYAKYRHRFVLVNKLYNFDNDIVDDNAYILGFSETTVKLSTVNTEIDVNVNLIPQSLAHLIDYEIFDDYIVLKSKINNVTIKLEIGDTIYIKLIRILYCVNKLQIKILKPDIYSLFNIQHACEIYCDN